MRRRATSSSGGPSSTTTRRHRPSLRRSDTFIAPKPDDLATSAVDRRTSRVLAIRTLRDDAHDEDEEALASMVSMPAAAPGTGVPRSLRVSLDARSTRSSTASSARTTRSPRHSRVERTIVLTDIVGSAAMWRDAPTKMMDLLDRMVPAVLGAAAEHDGQVIKMIGDAFMLVFDRPADAVRFVARLQTDLIPGLSSAALPLRMRAGVAHGPLHLRRMEMQHCTLVDYFGPTVNIAARAESGVSPVGGFAITLDRGVTAAFVRDALQAAGVAHAHLRRVRWSDDTSADTAAFVDGSSSSNSDASDASDEPTTGTRRRSSASGAVQTQVRSARTLKGVRPVPMLRVCFGEDATCLDSGAAASLGNSAASRRAGPAGPADPTPLPSFVPRASAVTADRSAATALRTTRSSAHVRFDAPNAPHAAQDGGKARRGRSTAASRARAAVDAAGRPRKT